ncbi:MAG TPA: hypothetical protein VGB77_21030 [Abditibacteriaceae bacterium]|jgi:hypothetical protein
MVRLKQELKRPLKQVKSPGKAMNNKDNKYRYHQIVGAADVDRARLLAVQIAGGNAQDTFLVKLQDQQGNLFYAADLGASEQLRNMMVQAAGALPSLSWFRMDVHTNELQASTEALPDGAIGQVWTFGDSLAVCNLQIVEVEI